jgi:hypothetical protein
LDSLHAFYRGELEEMPTLHSPAIEVEKYEIINQFFHTVLLEDGVVDPKKFRKILLKTRLFYTSGGVAYTFDKIIGEWFNNVFKFYISALGIKVEGGGILHLFDILNGGESNPLTAVWKETAEIAMDDYGVDLNDVQYGEGDWSKFDFSLLFEVLSHVGGLVTSAHVCPPDMDPQVFEHLMSSFIQRLSVKLLYMRGMEKWYQSQGTMNSGEFMTAGGNTAYHMILVVMYLMKLLSKYKNDPLVTLIINSGMIYFSVYSDDHVARWPRWMNTRTLYPESKTTLHDYIAFCINEAGMVYKWESLKIFDYLYGVRIYQTLEGGEVVETSYRPSLSFLRYTVAHVYFDGKYDGLQVHRDTEDLVEKMALSLNATKNMTDHMMLVASLARLSSGNYEVYYQLRALYFKLYSANGDLSADDWNNWYADTSKLPFSLRSVMGGKKIYTFPDLVDLQDLQHEGFINGTGFYATDYEGNRADGSSYFTHGMDMSSYPDPWVYDDSDDIEEVYIPGFEGFG